MSEKRKSKTRPGSGPGESAAASSPMDVRLLEQIVALMAAHDLNTVDVRDGTRRVILKRGAVVQTVAAPAAVAPMAAATRASTPAAAPAEAQPAAGEDESRYLRITSPMVGTFYAAAKPGEKPFVSVGATVGEDTDVCIIEAMKTFNNIKAECRGTVAKILVQDGQPVEFGATLFLVKPL